MNHPERAYLPECTHLAAWHGQTEDVRRALFPLLALAVAFAAGALVWTVLQDDEATRVPWRLTAEPTGSTIELRAEFGGSSCSEFDRWRVDESASEVEIQATARFEDGDCTADEVFETHSVLLDAPLDGRRLTGCLGSDTNAHCREVAQN